MAKPESNHMPKGLPAYLCTADGGFENLCKLLAIDTTRQKQAILGSSFVKHSLKGSLPKLASTTKQSERLQKGLSVFYSDPNARRLLWQKYVSDGDDGHQISVLLPSVEYEALKRFDEDLITNEPELGEIHENSEYYSSAAVSDDWRHVAIVALPQIKIQALEWKNLPPSRRNSLLIAAFATSTILDDVRFLRWCISHIEEASDAFPFLNSSRVSRPTSFGTTQTKDRKESQSKQSVLDVLKHEANCLEEAASQLTRTPLSGAQFDAVKFHAQKIEKMRGRALQFSEQNDTKGTIDSLSTYLRETAEEFSWFSRHVDGVVELWEKTYLSKNVTGLKELREEVEHKKRKLTKYFEDWLDANRKEQAARTALSKLPKSVETTDDGSVGLDSEYEHYRQISLFGPMRRELEEKILDTVKPNIVSKEENEQPIKSVDSNTKATPKKERDLSTSTTSDRVEEEQKLQASDDVLGPTATSTPTAILEGVADKPSSPSLEKENIENTAIWQTLDCGRLGIAYHIALLNEAINKKVEHPSSGLLAILALGLKIEGPGHELVLDFGRRVGSVMATLPFKGLDSETKDALNLLVFSASLRPALLAGQHDAVVMLQRIELSKLLTPVYSFADTMATHADKLKLVQFGGSLLGDLFDTEQWRARWKVHLESVNHWKKSRTPNFGYQPISRVWNHWMNSGGCLFELGKAISQESTQCKDRVGELVHELKHTPAKNLVRNTWKNGLKQHGQCGVSGRLLTQVDRHLQEPVLLAEQWLRLVETRPKQAKGWTQTTIEKLREDIRTHSKTALASIRKCQDSGSGLILRVSSQLAAAAISSIEETLLSAEGADKITFAIESEVLSSDLVFVKDLVLDHNGEIDDSVPKNDALKLLAAYPDGYVENLNKAFEVRLARGDLAGARAVHKCMKYHSLANESEAQEQLNKAFEERSQQLNQELDKLTEKLESSFIVGEVSEDKYSTLSTSIESARQETETNEQDNLLSAISLTNNTERELTIVVNECSSKLKERFDRHKDRLSAGDWKLIEEALESDDLIALHEYIDCVNLNRPLVSTDVEERQTFEKFLALLSQIDQESNLRRSALLGAFRRREDVYELRFSKFSKKQFEQVKALITPWLKMAERQTINESALNEFLSQLGLKLDHSATRVHNAENVVEVRANPLQDRELCPVHFYGSEAEGKYDFILSWAQPAHSFVIQAVRARPNRHTIVLHFGHLSREDRQRLRNWSIKNAIKFIVVDETLVFFLASFIAGRLRALFDCTLPFTCVEPFFTAAGLMPPESFYGREQERRSILDRYGSCFVYGGRQLGKTALLRSAAAAFHEPESHQVAICIDLKQHDVGPAFNPEIIWTVLTTHFVENGIISSERTRIRQRDRQISELKQHIRDWVSNEKNGRVLLLLDEADDFLAADLKNNFRESKTLKGMMDETDRKFKVVLCGLHNVLRNTERANHPLAHFGEPICVGPLLSEEEREHARALIREPLTAVGYVFENHGLMNHVLFRTNYYPSLIQIYGEHLVRHLRSSEVSGLPRAISKKDLDTVFSTEGLRDYIKQRFALTLQLDQRYEVIAYALAFQLRGDPSGPLKRFSAVEILELAREYWSEGFDISINEFETLLREMCGLGVLRRYNANANSVVYAFRNPNVLLLLGSEETIFEVLASERDLPNNFEAATYRAKYPDSKAPSFRRGPLTFEQENLLKTGGRVAVLCGTPIANLGDCIEFLKQRMDDDLLRELEPCANVAGLRKKLTGMRPSRYSVVCMVNDNDPYAMPWIEDTLTTLKRTKVGKLIRVVFLAGADELWNLLADLPESSLGEPSNNRVDWIGIHSWSKSFLRQWCMDQNLTEALANIEEFFDVSGGWPRILEEYARLRDDTRTTKRERLLKYIQDNEQKLLEDLGLNSRDAISQLRILRDYKALSLEEASQYEEMLIDDNAFEYAPGTLQRRLFWARKLGLVIDTGGSRTLNPLVDRLLAQDH